VTGARSLAGGFTLVELTVALLLMAAMSAILFGSLSLAARSWDGGEGKAHEVSDMRSTQEYLRAQLSAQYPHRLWKAGDVPVLFAGESGEIRYAAALPSRVAEGGVYYFRVAVERAGEKSQLIQERTLPDNASEREPEFREAGRSVLADGIAEIRIGYFGRDANASDVDAPTWRDRWEDRFSLPLLVRIDVKPVKGAPWPTLVVEPRRALEAGCPQVLNMNVAQRGCARAV
jgi:general secretion pathway protein J